MSNHQRVYSPSATIASLHLRKRAYQINFCKALALTVSIFVLAIFIITLSLNKREPVQLTRHSGYLIDASKILLQNKAGDTHGGGQHSPGSPLANKYDGFGGFEGYRVAHGARGVKAAVYRPSTSSNLEPDMGGLTPGSIKFDENFGFSNFAYGDGNFDYGLPKRNINSDRVWKLPRDPGQKVKQLKNEMMAIKLERVIHPKGAAGIRGEVQLHVTIDNRGNILNCEVLREQPEGYGFARALRSAIYESLIFPPVVNGAKVGAEITITHLFCGYNCQSSYYADNIYVFGPATD